MLLETCTSCCWSECHAPKSAAWCNDSFCRCCRGCGASKHGTVHPSSDSSDAEKCEGIPKVCVELESSDTAKGETDGTEEVTMEARNGSLRASKRDTKSQTKSHDETASSFAAIDRWIAAFGDIAKREYPRFVNIFIDIAESHKDDAVISFDQLAQYNKKTNPLEELSEEHMELLWGRLGAADKAGDGSTINRRELLDALGVRVSKISAHFVRAPDLQNLTELPRFGTDDDFHHPLTKTLNLRITKPYEELDKEKHLFVFISHRWLRPHPGSMGHPDDEMHNKLKLIQQVLVGLLPRDLIVAVRSITFTDMLHEVIEILSRCVHHSPIMPHRFVMHFRGGGAEGHALGVLLENVPGLVQLGDNVPYLEIFLCTGLRQVENDAVGRG